jgi:RNA polymerase sigma-70 factor (ECF subfamily)
VTEDNYVELIKQHQEKALRYFIDHHGWIVKSIISKMLYQFPNSREECMNDVFLAVWQHADSYDEMKGGFKNWVAAVTKYKAISYIRAHSKELTWEYLADLEQEIPIKTAEMPVESEAQQEFLALIKCLNQEDQRLFIKYFMEEKNGEEISAEMGLKRDVIYNRLSRGKKKIKREMESRCDI